MGHRGSPGYAEYTKNAHEYNRNSNVGYDYNYDPACNTSRQQEDAGFDPYCDDVPSSSAASDQQYTAPSDDRGYTVNEQHSYTPSDHPSSGDNRSYGASDNRGYTAHNNRRSLRRGRRPARRASPDYSAYEDSGSHPQMDNRREYHTSSYREHEERNPHVDRNYGISQNTAVSETTSYGGGYYQTTSYGHQEYTEHTEQPQPQSTSYVSPLYRNAHVVRPTTPPRSPPRRSPTPPPALPTTEYLQTSKQPSHALEDPSSARKLLILDLNGTLVFRGPHKRREHRPKNRWAKNPEGISTADAPTGQGAAPTDQGASDPYADPTALRPLRTVHARPFLTSFRDYLFHSKTRAWLDTMVWSSAQPHSVEDMVEKAFKEKKDELVGVWARDTLGLSEGDYNRKTQTTKDLAKPWAGLPLLSSSNDEGPSTEANAAVASQHSAETTLLLDDSPLKAHLQPWNHLCIREYVSEMRAADVAARDAVVVAHRLAEEQAAPAEERPAAEQTMDQEEIRSPEVAAKSESGAETSGVDSGLETPVLEPLDTTAEHGGVEDIPNKKKRKREKKKKSKALQLTSKLGARDLVAKYDRTLLAVVGVLDAIKNESNVAGWMRAGGLISSVDAEGEHAAAVRGEEDMGMEGGGQPSAEEDLSTAVRSPKKKRRISDEGKSEDEGSAITSRSSPMLPPSSSQFSMAPSSPARSLNEETLTQATTGVPMAEEDDAAAEEAQARAEVPAKGPKKQPAAPTLWFENEKVLDCWAARGVKALEELGIEVAAGVVGSHGI